MASEPGFDALTTEGRDSRLADLDLKSTLDLVLLMNDRDAAVAPAVRRVAPEVAALVDGVSSWLSGGGRLVYAGAGSAGRLGQLDAVECPPTFGLDEGRVVGLLAGGGQAEVRATEEAEDDPRAGVDDLRAIDVGSGDAVVAISASGRTPYAVAAARHAAAGAALEAAGGETRTAIVTLLTGLPVPAAREVVARHASLRAALTEAGGSHVG